MTGHVLQEVVLICTLISFFFIPMSRGAFISSTGPCPHGYKEGDTWLAGIRCGGCSCHADGWNCVTCAGSDVGLRVDCYEIYNPNASFPDCCPTRVCKGYENFNQTQLDLFGK